MSTERAFFPTMEEFGFFSHIYEKLPPDFTAIFEIARILEMPTERVRRTMKITREPISLEMPVGEDEEVWMSHGDSITRLPEGFHATAQTDSTPYAGLADPARNLYGIQFHPEVVHTPIPTNWLRNSGTYCSRWSIGRENTASTRKQRCVKPMPSSSAGFGVWRRWTPTLPSAIWRSRKPCGNGSRLLRSAKHSC